MALAAFQAEAAGALIGTSCSQLGQTKIDADGKNIIACVCNATANCNTSGLVWKTMTNGTLTTGTISCPSGQIMTAISATGAPTCSSGK
ncbi:MAG: hypothetical protein WC464_08075 [Bdellovibrionales bacterium]